MGTTQKTASVTLTLTEPAAAEVRKFLAEEKVDATVAGLRVGVMPGGCSGFKYALNIEDKPADDDHVIESSGIRLFVDDFSAQDLNATPIDYPTNFHESASASANP